MSESSQVKRYLISSITNLVHKLPHELPNDFGIFADGGAQCPHKKKKKTQDLKKLGNIRKMSNVGVDAA